MIRRVLAAAAAAGIVVACAPPLGGQTLRGSHASVELMYDRARASDLRFFQTSNEVVAAAMSGRLKVISVSDDVTIDEALYPYVLPRTLEFIQRFAAQYRAACGERIVVTSGTRPSARQPRNASPESVHPTGMAVDFRRPAGGCLTWIRKALLTLENQGVIEATEERRPPHFHVAVLAGSRTQYAVSGIAPVPQPVAEAVAAPAMPPVVAPVAPTKAATSMGEVAARDEPATGSRRYRVKSGDTLWDIARRYHTTVARLKALNGLGASGIMPGQRLRLP
jgi:hypothetical protein